MSKSEGKKGGMGIVIFISIVLFLGTILGVWGYLIKTNKYINLGDILRPYIQDVPIINMILPGAEADADPATFARGELERLYIKLLAENEVLTKKNNELEEEVIPLRETKEKYDILLKEVDNLKETVKIFEAKSLEAETEEEKLNKLVKVYETMEASEAASVLEQMGTLNINLVINICRNMKNASFSAILQEMDTDFAAILSERMLED